MGLALPFVAAAVAGCAAAAGAGAGAGAAIGYSTRSRLQIETRLTDEMISILLKTVLPAEGLLALEKAMKLPARPIESYLQTNRQVNESGSEKMIKEWRQSLRDQNQVAAMCELMVKANMKPQADKFYGKCDRIINAAKLDILEGIIKGGQGGRAGGAAAPLEKLQFSGKQTSNIRAKPPDFRASDGDGDGKKASNIRANPLDLRASDGDRECKNASNILVNEPLEFRARDGYTCSDDNKANTIRAKSRDFLASGGNGNPPITNENIGIKTFDENGGCLYLKRYDVTLKIPSGALERGSSRQIALKVLTRMPFPLTKLEKNEIIASLGFQGFPSGLKFKKTVTLTMPHCADLIDPSMCKLILHLVQGGLENDSITRSQLSLETCRVRKNHFDLSLKHFTWGFVTWLWNSLWIRGINMLCIPYLPSQVPPERKVILHVCLYKHIKGCQTSVSRGDDDVRACLLNAEEFTLQSSGKSPLTVSYQFGGENETPDYVVLSYEDIAQTVTCKSAYLDVDLVGRGRFKPNNPMAKTT